MKIAVTAEKGTPESPVDSRFGRAKYFIVHDTETGAWTVIDNIQNLQSAQGAGIQSASAVVNAGCETVLTGHCGPKAFAALGKAGVTVYLVAGGTVREAIDSMKKGELHKIDSADVEEHW